MRPGTAGRWSPGPARAASGCPCTGPGDGPDGNDVVLDSREDLGRAPDECEPIELEEIQIRRGIERTKHSVELEGLRRHGHRQPLAQNHLEGVAGKDVLSDPLDSLFELRTSHRAGKRGVLSGLRAYLQGWRRGPLGKLGDQALGLFGRLVVPAAKLLVVQARFDLDSGDRHGTAKEVIDGKHDIREHEKTVGQSEIVLRFIGKPLDLAHHIVPEVPYCTSPESRETPGGQWLSGSQPLVEIGQGVGGGDW